MCDTLINFFENNKNFWVNLKTIGDIENEKKINYKKEILSSRKSKGLVIDELMKKKPLFFSL